MIKTNEIDQETIAYFIVCLQWIFGDIVTCDVTCTSVHAFVSSVRSPSHFLPSYSLGRTTASATAVVVMRRCRVMVFEKREVVDKTGWGAQQHTNSHDAGMRETADVATCMQNCRCTSDIWHSCSTAASIEATRLWQINIIL